jgi:lipoate-protein ligase B
MNAAMPNLANHRQTTIATLDAGITAYQAAWDVQINLHQRVLSGELPGGILMLVEHPPTITIGRRPDAHRGSRSGLHGQL